MNTQQLNNEFFASLLDALHIPVFAKDREHRFVYLNDAICRLCGFNKEKTIGKTDYDFFPTEQADIFRAKDEKVFNTKLPLVNEEFLTDQNGQVHTIQTTKSILTDSKGNSYLVGYIHDITEQRLLEHKLREHLIELEQTKERFQLAASAGELGTWDWQIKTGEAFFDERWKSMLGYAKNEIPNLASAFFDLIHPDDKSTVTSAVEAHFRQISPTYSLELRMLTKSGNYHWIYTKGLVVERTARGEPIRMSGIHISIHERKKMEEELKMAKTIAELAAKTKGEFVTNVSHEIRTPLNCVIGMSELLLETQLDAVQKEMVHDLQESGRNLLTLINDILDFSKIEAGRLELYPDVIDFKAMLDSLQRAFKFEYLSKKIDLSVEIEEAISQYVYFDETRLKQILFNLLGNALKFTNPGGKVVLVANLDSIDNNLIITIKDNGIGIPIEAQNKIFDVFTQADASITRRYGGTGLGLAIASRLAHLMGGKISAESEHEVGSTFKLNLPYCPSLQTDLAKHTKSQVIPKIQALNILVAEDNQINQKLIKVILENEGHKVTIVDNGESAVQSNMQFKYDLICMDIQMPIKDGESATKQIRSGGINQNVPILALTAHALKGDEERFIAIGMNGYISKPIDRLELYTKIAMIVNSKVNVSKHD